MIHSIKEQRAMAVAEMLNTRKRSSAEQAAKLEVPSYPSPFSRSG
jgi:hypothetical protein